MDDHDLAVIDGHGVLHTVPLASGADAVLDKPYKVDELLRVGNESPNVGVVGPLIATSQMCGGSVVPALPVPCDACDQSCGLIRSS